MGKLRDEASQGHLLVESTVERRALLLARHGALLRVLAFGEVLLRAAGVQLHPQHPDGERSPITWLQRKILVSMAASPASPDVRIFIKNKSFPTC